MKTVYIPGGEISSFGSLYADIIVVKGVLRVSGRLSVRKILGGGTVEAQEIICDDLRVNATADNITARRIAADKLFVRGHCRASEAIAIRDYIAADYVSTGKLSMTLSDIRACDADEIIALRRGRGLLGLLWISWWRGLFLSLFYGEGRKNPTAPQEDKTDGRGGMAA